MSKELEALERYGYHCNHYVNGEKDYKLIETALIRLEEYNKFLLNINSIANQLKALEIIKKKYLKIDFKALLASTDYETYCFFTHYVEGGLTQEEYDLLKEMLL